MRTNNEINDAIKVSIVVAVYNGANTLPRCLNSLIGQSYKNIEIICVNDCSPDNSLEILKEYASQYSNIHIISHKENMHGGGAGNTGINNSTGEYVCFVDQDDTLNKTAIESLIANSHGGDNDIVLGQWCTVDADNNTMQQSNLIIGGTREENTEYALLHGVRVLGGLFKKKLYEQNYLFYPEHVNWADNAIYNAILIAAEKICVIKESIYNYYIDTQSSSSKQVSVTSIKDRIYTSDLSYSNCNRMDVDNQYTELIAFRYLFLTGYTVEFLGELPYKDARPMAEYLHKRIDEMLPNKYFNRIEPIYQKYLLDPVGFVKKVRNKRIKEYFHSKRHRIVVCIKKLLGIDPSQSIYEKKAK